MSLCKYLRFYLVILPLSIKWAPVKYHINSLGMTKTQGFYEDLYGYDFLLYPSRLRERFRFMTSSIRVFLKAQQIFTKTIMSTRSGSLIKLISWKHKTIYDKQKILRKNTHPYTIMRPNIKITVLLGKDYGLAR